MAAPEFVPLKPTDRPRWYKSSPRRPESWMADRPGEVVDVGQPRGPRFGNIGPDQGYVLVLARLFDDKLVLSQGEDHEDVIAGAMTVALKRASLFGRAPIVHDLTVALTIWGFLDAQADKELVMLRRDMFAEARIPYHYETQRAIADAVPESTLRMPHAAAIEAYRTDWRSLLEL